MLPGKSLTPEFVVGMVRRRFWLLILPLAIAGAVTALYARQLPDMYSADTVILVVPQKIPEAFVRSTVSDNIADRLQTITPTILSRSRLERIIQDYNLYPQERGRLPMEDVVALMRRNVVFPQTKDNSFTIRYTGENPRQVAQVANRLSSLFIDENLADRRNQAEGTDNFLESRLAEAKAKLIEKEKALEAYKREHAGELPSQIGSNLQQVDAAQSRVSDTRSSIDRAQERRLVLEQQLAALQKPGAVDPEALAATSRPPGADAPPSGVQQQLAQAENQVTALEAKGLKAGHPDLDQARRRVRDLRAQVAREAAEAAAGTPSTPTRALSSTELERRRQVSGLQAQIAEIDSQIARMQQDATRFQAVADDAQRRADAMPARESELTELSRDYGILQASYNTLLGKKQDSQIAANLEEQAVGEQFKLLDPAQVPGRPYSPNRMAINTTGAAAGLGLGVLLIAFLEYRDRSFRTDDEVGRVLGLPVLAVIPLMQSDLDLRRSRWRAVVTYVALGGVVIGCAGLFLFAVGH
ncbi:MAG: Wzz/FepE/Etk N-terminal domain-containing protein [Acidobacteriota bacterium]